MDKFGNTNSFLYDPRGNLIQTTHADGLMTRTVFDDNGRAYLTTDRNGITGTQTYFDAAGRATNVVRLTNVVVTITDGPRSVVSNAGTAVSSNLTEYLPSGWMKSRTSADNQKTTYAYWPDGQLMFVTNALNQTTFYKYDIAGRQEYVTDALNRTNRFEYDAIGRMVKTVFHNGTFTTNIFNLLGQRVGVKDQAGFLTQFTYDVSGQLTNVLKPGVIDPENGYVTNSPSWTYKFDQYGRQTETIDPRVHSTTNSFDAYGRAVSRWLPVGDAGTTNYYNALGQLTNQIDFKGQKRQARYDRFGRVTNMLFFEAGAGITHPSNTVCYYYNQLGQLTNITERFGTDASSTYIASVGGGNGTGHSPDTMWTTLCATVNRIPPDVQGGSAALLLCVFALFSIPREKRRALAECFAQAWFENVTSFTFSASTGEKVVADRMRCRNHLPSSILHLPSSLVALYSFAAFVLRCGGSPDGTPKRFRLPSYGWRFATLITLIAMIGSDPAFQPLWTARAACTIPSNPNTLPNTRITEFSYDVEGRLAQVNSPEGCINYNYDLVTGRHVGTCSLKSEMTYEYDALGRLWKVNAIKRNGSAINETTIYTYTAVGSRDTVTLPNGVKTGYAYDNLNRLIGLTNRASDNSILSQFNYQVDATGRRTNATEIVKQEDVTTTYQTNTLSWAFDGLYRLTNEVCISTVSGASYTNQFRYDKAGNRWSQVKIVASGTTTITNQYNANDQLLKEVTLVSGAPTATNNYVYDANGSLIAKTNVSGSGSTLLYGYDLKNKLMSVTTAGSSLTNFLTYNEAGIRVRTTPSTGNATLYLVDGNNHTGYAQVLEETTASTLTSYVIGDDMLAQAVDSGTASYLLCDGHGSTRQLAPNTANTTSVTSRYNYDSYGTALSTSSSTAQTSLLYCGEQYESALGMYNLRARFYDPSNGRFNAMDTFMGNNDDPQSLHKYAYCHGDPVNFADSSGYSEIGTAIGRLAVIALIAVIIVLVVYTLAYPGIGAKGRLDVILTFWSSRRRQTILPDDENKLTKAKSCSPEEVILLYKDWINKQSHIAPPELIAAVLLNELRDYNMGDVVGDRVLRGPSRGITQMNEGVIDEHGYMPVGATREDIKEMLLQPKSAIELLAKEISYYAKVAPFFAERGGLLETWGNSTEEERESIVAKMAGAKDFNNYEYSTEFSNTGIKAYRDIKREKMLNP